MEPAFLPATDRGEQPSLMEPMRIPGSASVRREIEDLALDLATASAGFQSAIPEGVRNPLSDLVRTI